MKDAFGQERAPVRARELTIAALFVVFVGVGIWAVALPALREDPDKTEAAAEDQATATAPRTPSP